jgi:hypothetical protein|tara:strand:- start:295 stop:516 length:222 start_codon:yes stop_codon:yes gene_type:complete
MNDKKKIEDVLELVNGLIESENEGLTEDQKKALSGIFIEFDSDSAIKLGAPPLDGDTQKLIYYLKWIKKILTS